MLDHMPDVDIIVPVHNEQHRAGAQRPAAAPLPARRLPVHLADRHRRQRQCRRHAGDRPRARRRPPGRLLPAAGAQGARARAAHRLGGQRRARRRVHGRRPLHGPARAAAARRAAAVGPQRRRDRHAPGARRPRRARPQAGADLARYNALLRTVLRARFSDAQCGFKAVRREALDGLLDERQGRGLVLRHRAARARPAARAADPRGAGRLDRRPRLAREHRLHRARPTSRACAPARRRPDPALPRHRRPLHARVRRPLPGPFGRGRRRRRERARARRDRRRQHGRQPRADVRRARARAARAPSPARRARVRPHAALTSGALAVLHGLDAAPRAGWSWACWSPPRSPPP